MNARSSLLFRTIPVVAACFALPALSGCVAETPDELADEPALESPEPVETVDQGVSSATVAQAADSSCATSSVKALSKQIIAEARCMNGDAYVAITGASNVSFGSSVFAYLEKPARDKLVAALKANSGKTMTVNSALRTVAQQYLLYRWYKTGRCGISLAATPGTSNHETGLALDISQYSTWKPILTNYGFKWLGSGDPVHFDYVGAGAVNHKGLDVKAFQRLWNRNHPSDKISEDGDWGPQTEARMKKAPSAGFATGATCGIAIELGDQDDEDSIRAITPSNEAIPGLTIHDEADLEHVDESCADSAL